jgi:guanine nucleotide-binding protein subunit alpha
MKLIHAQGFSKIERENFRIMIFTNLLGSMQALLESMQLLQLTFSNQNNWVSVSRGRGEFSFY